VHMLSTGSGRVISTLATLSLVITGCSSDGGSTDPTGGSASTATIAPSAGSSDPGTSAAPTEAPPEGSSSGGDTGPAAAPGEGRLEVNGTTYALTISECKFTTDGPTKGTFEVRGTEAGGAPFEMTQFYLSDQWSQTSVQLDLGATKVYVIRSGVREGAVPATVDGQNVTWIESYHELDEAANSQVALGDGVLNLTCA